MKILSWDVGIKNLAYCLLEKINDDFEIKQWGLINLVEDRQKCQFILNSGEQCSEIAKSCIYHTDKIQLFKDTDQLFCCTRHKTKLMPSMININDSKPVKKTKSKKNDNEIINNKKCMHCDEKCDYELLGTTFGWCNTHYDKKGQSFVKKIRSKKVTVTGCTKQPWQDLGQKLFTKLDNEFPDFVKVDKVLIENQPGLKNPSMKTMASILFSYFIMRGIIDKNNTHSIINEVAFVSPSNKLKVNEINTNKLLNDEKEKNINNTEQSKVYKLTKSLGIKYCKALINEEDTQILNKVKKKDDMCDAFLQGFQYLFSPLSLKYFNKLKTIGFEQNENNKIPKNKKNNKP